MRLLGYQVSYSNHSAAFFLVHEVFVNGAYAFEPPTRRPRIVDCGANIGMSVIFFKSLYPEAEVLAFEPDPRTFARLRENVEVNRLAQTRLVNAAVAGAPGTLPFYSDAAGDGSLVASLDPARGGSVAVAVKVVRLSSFVDRTIDFLKIDVEGAEHAVVDDLIDSGSIVHVREMVIEVHSDPDGSRNRDDLIARLDGAGFVIAVSELDDGAALVRAVRAPPLLEGCPGTVSGKSSTVGLPVGRALSP